MALVSGTTHMQVSDGLVSEWKVGSERKDSVETQAVVSEHVVTMGIGYQRFGSLAG